MFSNILLGAFIIAAFGSGECNIAISSPASVNETVPTTIKENAKSGLVFVVAATGATGAVTFTVISPKTEFEFANKALGNLTVKSTANLDYEKATKQVVVFVVSNGTTNVTGSLIVNIADINDNAPIFNQTTYSVNVADKLKAGSSVANVTATDDDKTTKNKVIRYSITSASNNASFEISSTGAITVATGKSLSRALIPNYALVVLATDSGTEPKQLTGTATVSVCVGTRDECSSGAKSITASLMSLIVTYVVYYSM